MNKNMNNTDVLEHYKFIELLYSLPEDSEFKKDAEILLKKMDLDESFCNAVYLFLFKYTRKTGKYMNGEDINSKFFNSMNDIYIMLLNRPDFKKAIMQLVD
jgi:hypothetical protein